MKENFKINNFIQTLPKPIPSGGNDYYQYELKQALSFCKKRSENYDLYLSSNRRSSNVNYLPIKLDIENVSRCNFACQMCAVADWEKGKRAPDMSLADFKNLIDEQYGLVEIKLNGLGEALMQGNDYFEMIKYARSKKIWVRMTTNASLLHVKENYKKLVDTDVNEIDISIDGVTKDVFEKIRKQSKFEMVVNNCKLINGYLKSLDKVRTKMWVLLQKDNFHQLNDFLPLADDMGFKHLIFSLNLHGWGDKKLELVNHDRIIDFQLSEKELNRIVEDGNSRGIRVSFWDVNSKFDISSPEKLCPWPFERAVVTSDLRTVPCCMIGNPDQYEIGKGTKKTFTQLWKSDEYVKFRKDHIEGKIPIPCKGCYK